ncbi:BnaC02g33300D [Brassica napus]|uniref:Uncharacterized protein n=3 Tax=Brassica TaxID=3705 RepID=A0A0D3AUZ0_BRAOL|nr:unnamed protein product [Brassica napus]CDY40562.1 BnaC02g33300D [Brassica napus]VDD25635.1 unnamed protein product [Brassica oleracea]
MVLLEQNLAHKYGLTGAIKTGNVKLLKIIKIIEDRHQLLPWGRHNGDGTIDKLCMFQVPGPNYLGELLEAIDPRKLKMLEVSLRETRRASHAEIVETTKPNQTDTTYSQMLNGLERKTIRTTMINANHVWSQSVSHATARVTSATATSSLSH